MLYILQNYFIKKKRKKEKGGTGEKESKRKNTKVGGKKKEFTLLHSYPPRHFSRQMLLLFCLLSLFQKVGVFSKDVNC